MRRIHFVALSLSVAAPLSTPAFAEHGRQDRGRDDEKQAIVIDQGQPVVVEQQPEPEPELNDVNDDND